MFKLSLKDYMAYAHQFLFLFSQLLVLKFLGLAYSGSLALIGAISTFLAVIINLRWDIEILLKKGLEVQKSISKALFTVVFCSSLIILVNIFLNQPLHTVVIFAGIAIATNEILASIIFSTGKILLYSFSRCIPALLILFFAFRGYEPNFTWFYSYLFSCIFMILMLKKTLIISFSESSLKSLKNLEIKNKISASAGAISIAFISAFIVYMIDDKFGQEFVGIWANAYRIFNSIPIFLITGYLPFLLKNIGLQNAILEKVNLFMSVWASIFILCLLILVIISLTGDRIFLFFSNYSDPENPFLLSKIFMVGMILSFVGTSQGLFQDIDKSHILLVISLVMILIMIFIFYSINISFDQLVTELLLMVLISLLLIVSFLYKTSLTTKKEINRK
jgi:hypothetical protein